MDLFNNLIFGFSVAFSLQNLLYCLIGVSVGTLIGVLPGIGPLGTMHHKSIFRERGSAAGYWRHRRVY